MSPYKRDELFECLIRHWKTRKLVGLPTKLLKKVTKVKIEIEATEKNFNELGISKNEAEKLWNAEKDGLKLKRSSKKNRHAEDSCRSELQSEICELNYLENLIYRHETARIFGMFWI
jgi:septation ring formation regulator EzrA